MPRYSTRDNTTEQFHISLLDCVVLLDHLYRCPDLKYDINNTTIEIMEKLKNKHIKMFQAQLESCLYGANLLNEAGQFWHPQGKSFDKFVSDIIPEHLRYSKYYNYVVEKYEKEESD